MTNLAALTHVGPYQVEHVVRSGLFTATLRGTDPLAGRTVVLKVFMVEPETAPDSFLAEARILTMLKHPHIVQTFETGTVEVDDGIEYFYLAEQELSGPRLADRLKNGPLPIDEALSIITRLASGLDYIHKHGVVHRDLQPCCIAFSDQHDPVLVEFGLERLLVSADQTVEPGFGLSESAYLAPEQIIGENLAGPSTDQYALALIAFQLLTGKMPFQALKLRDIINERLYGKPLHASTVRPALGTALDTVFTRAFNRVPALRYPTAALFAADLADSLKASSAQAAGTPASPQETQPRPLLHRLFNSSRS